MKVKDFEEAVWKIDHIRIIVRAASWVTVDDYRKANAADKGMSVTDYLKRRIQPCIAEHELAVIGGDGKPVHGRTLLSKVRDGYDH